MMEPTDQFEKYADELLVTASVAAARFRSLDQEEVDRIVEAVYRAAYGNRLELARLAIEETGAGVYDHKVQKNAWASLLVYEEIRNRKTVGVVGHDEPAGITEIAQPKGPVLATIPVTNPTSTAIFKILICMKTRNPIILSAHGGARKCVRETARLLGEAAVAAGAPSGSVQVVTKPHKEVLDHVMRHRKLALILATGTGAIVRAAQSSGTPTFGVGPGNVPVYVDRTADVALAARYLVHSKTFDNGTVCASEQALVVTVETDATMRAQLIERGSYFCSPEEVKLLDAIAFDSQARTMKADVVGRSAVSIAERCGFAVPEKTRLLIAEPGGVGREHPLSHEILAPILAYYVVRDYDEAIETCLDLSEQGGVGHTVGLYANDDQVIEDFGRLMNVGRIVVNQPTTQGAVGGLFNTLSPSLTLACGTGAGNITTDNITVTHLLNIHRIARRRLNGRWMEIPRETWLDPSVSADEIRRIYNRNY